MGNMNGQSRAQEAIPELILISSTRKKSADIERRKYFTPQHVVWTVGWIRIVPLVCIDHQEHDRYDDEMESPQGLPRSARTKNNARVGREKE
jgi:hypothetical protein